ncbi:MAG: cyanophycinase [Oscillatoriales cyanobacterium]|nr:MAG: cyanophycinase [Oscillatoriales cyanobacterium]
MVQAHTRMLDRSTPQAVKAAVMVIGGAEDKIHGREILHAFFQRSGGAGARIAIIPSASREPAVIGSKYRSIFESMGATSVEILDVRDRDQGTNASYLEYAQTCTGVFMTGGDQLRLCGLLADTRLMNSILDRVHRFDITLAGTSAGAAVMGHHMIAGGGSGESPNRSLVDMATGFGVLPHTIVDQHFHNRNRMARLLSAVSLHPDRLGIGIDEDTCACFEDDGVIEVLGKGTVTIVDAADMTYTNQSLVGATDPVSLHSLRLNVLSYGDRYSIPLRRVVSTGPVR